MPLGKKCSYILLHLAVLCWAYTGLVGAEISFPVHAIVWDRMAIASLVLGFALTVSGVFRRTRLSERGLVECILAGLILTAHWYCFFAAVRTANVSVGLGCLAATPLFTTLIEASISRRPPLRYELALSFLTLSGLALLLGVDAVYLTGVLWGLTAAVLDAAFNLLNCRLVRRHHPLAVTWVELTSGAVALSLVGLASETPPWTILPANSYDLAAILFLGVLATAVAICGYAVAMQRISAYSVALIVNLEPVYGITLALLLRGEKELMNKTFYLGGALTILSVFLDTLFKNGFFLASPQTSDELLS